MHYTCTACITIDSVMKMDKKYFPQVYLEECKYKIKKIQISRFIDAELDSESDSESESDNDSDNDSNNDSDNDSDNDSKQNNIFSHKWFSQIIVRKFFYNCEEIFFIEVSQIDPCICKKNLEKRC